MAMIRLFVLQALIVLQASCSSEGIKGEYINLNHQDGFPQKLTFENGVYEAQAPETSFTGNLKESKGYIQFQFESSVVNLEKQQDGSLFDTLNEQLYKKREALISEFSLSDSVTVQDLESLLISKPWRWVIHEYDTSLLIFQEGGQLLRIFINSPDTDFSANLNKWSCTQVSNGITALDVKESFNNRTFIRGKNKNSLSGVTYLGKVKNVEFTELISPWDFEIEREKIVGLWSNIDSRGEVASLEFISDELLNESSIEYRNGQFDLTSYSVAGQFVIFQNGLIAKIIRIDDSSIDLIFSDSDSILSFKKSII